jgi:hypothetical protein
MNIQDFSLGIVATGLFILFLLSFRKFLNRPRIVRVQSIQKNSSNHLGLFHRLMGNTSPIFYDESGHKIETCTIPETHKYKNDKCVWCGEVQGLALQRPSNLSKPDLNSPTSLTVNSIKPEVKIDLPEIKINKAYGSMSDMSLASIQAYCVKCKVKVEIINSATMKVESSRGVRNYIKGQCSVCGTNVSAIIKGE